MAQSYLSGLNQRVAGAPVTRISGPGRLLGYHISCPVGAATPTVVFYDGLTTSASVLHRVYTQSGAIVFIRFGEGHEAEGLEFSTGLTLDPGSCEVTVWAVEYK